MNIKTVVLKTISENTAQSGKIYGSWILQYFVDGKSVSVKVVCGEKKIKEGGDIWWVSKGMAPKDFDTLKPHYQEFLAFSKNPPAMPQAEAPEQTPEVIEETPF